MEPLVYFVVIVAACLHASWNALLKGGADKYVGMTAVVVGHAPIALALMPFAPRPEPESWPYIIAGVALHSGYQIFLMASYRIGDLTQVYPIARGSAPLLVAAVSVLFLGVVLSSTALMAVAAIGIGIMSLSFVRQADGQRNMRAALLAFTTGCFIAGYSLVDGLGARAAGTSLGFYAWLALLNAVVFALTMRIWKPGTLTRVATGGRTMLLVGGAGSFTAYALVMWAFTQAPIALVTALRETSIVFALLIGVVFLKERLDLAKVASTMVTVAGAILVRYAR